MKKYFDELKNRIYEDMPNMSKKAICAYVGSINAFMEMGFISGEEWDFLIETLFRLKYLTKEEYAEIIDYGT